MEESIWKSHLSQIEEQVEAIEQSHKKLKQEMSKLKGELSTEITGDIKKQVLGICKELFSSQEESVTHRLKDFEKELAFKFAEKTLIPEIKQENASLIKQSFKTRLILIVIIIIGSTYYKLSPDVIEINRHKWNSKFFLPYSFS